MDINDRIWAGMVDISEKMLLGVSSPNESLVTEALSFDVSSIDAIPIETLRKYIVVLGQYLVSLQFEENRTEAESTAWSKVLDSYVYSAMRSSSDSEYKSIKTVAEKKAWILEKDSKAVEFNTEFLVADVKRKIVRNMYKAVDQYINTLKKEIDARAGEKKYY